MLSLMPHSARFIAPMASFKSSIPFSIPSFHPLPPMRSRLSSISFTATASANPVRQLRLTWSSLRALGVVTPQ